MRAADVLALVLEAGGRIVYDPDWPRIQAPPHFRPLIEEHREALREIVRAQAPAPAPPLAKTPDRWPEGTALVVAPSWWPGPPFWVVRTEPERAALVGDGEHPGQVWTLEEARRLAGPRPDEKLTIACIRAEFGGQVVKSRARRTRSGRE